MFFVRLAFKDLWLLYVPLGLIIINYIPSVHKVYLSAFWSLEQTVIISSIECKGPINTTLIKLYTNYILLQVSAKLCGNRTVVLKRTQRRCVLRTGPPLQ